MSDTSHVFVCLTVRDALVASRFAATCRPTPSSFIALSPKVMGVLCASALQAGDGVVPSIPSLPAALLAYVMLTLVFTQHFSTVISLPSDAPLPPVCS